MSEFYKELKSIREDQGIDLEEIHNRTKINLNYLQAIENGQFDLLPHTYVRLFIRAYATEIGADPEEIVSNLELFLGNKVDKPSRKKQDQPLREDGHDLAVEEKVTVQSPSRSAQNVRSQMIKGITLVVILLFAIYIINVINAEAAAKEPLVYPSVFLDENSISEQELQNNFDVLTESVQILELESPYNLKLATAERVWYRSKIDTLTSIENVLPSGDNRLYEFSHSIEILFEHTIGLNLYLNGSKLNSFDSTSNPVRISLSAVNKTVTIQHFVPKS
ncbi:MAG: helix-turn-helix domain-containing protein [Candidatus Marinimicrobia bacterium]|nr:helix-turn-helix domain-containing protein [Candidatus Neomarinimicrobiota bacterium]MBL7010380.1 helix-turn-helix domain-containing protein [Candidatus Neomarinimicrobiota bacterium]MBL7030771.1 helix-turn-helix domain-containing protein [Candidatus Neomarinimicrobiota bacterium]